MGEGREPRERRRRRSAIETGGGGERVVRLSIDLPVAHHLFLKLLAYDAGVTQMAVGRALVALLHDDPNFAALVLAMLGGPGTESPLDA